MDITPLNVPLYSMYSGVAYFLVCAKSGVNGVKNKGRGGHFWGRKSLRAVNFSSSATVYLLGCVEKFEKCVDRWEMRA